MQSQVKEFMTDVKHLDTLTKPGVPSMETVELCNSLIVEEIDETRYALELFYHLHPLLEDIEKLALLADGIADSIYVLLYTASVFGIDIDPIFNEIHRSNMTKIGGEKRADGKQLKPASYEPPRIKEIILDQQV